MTPLAVFRRAAIEIDHAAIDLLLLFVTLCAPHHAVRTVQRKNSFAVIE